MDAFAVAIGFAICAAFWFLLTKSMKINGRPWWWRHLSAALLSPLAVLGGSILAGSMLGLSDAEGEPLGVTGALSGITVLIPLLLPLWISRRAAKQNAPSALAIQPLRNSEPEPEPEPASKEELPPNALRFTYEDFNGDLTQRTLTNWREEGAYIKGFCLDRRDTRTFRKERIVAFSEGEHLLRGSAAMPEPGKPVADDKPMEILFTGFPKDKRADLEEQATEEGMIVRTRVTKALDFLCVGPKAAPSKQAQAEERGTTVLDEMAFYDLLESGELPERL